MVSTQEALESKYVSVDLVKRNVQRQAVIVSPGEYENTDYGRKLSLLVDYVGKQLKLRLNKDSVKGLDSAYGSDTQSWVGKSVVFTTYFVKGKEILLVNPLPPALSQPRMAMPEVVR